MSMQLSLDEYEQKLGQALTLQFIEDTLAQGKIVETREGMCAKVYIIDHGENVFPRFIVAKVPKVPIGQPSERASRFIREMKLQHETYYHRFVLYPFDYRTVLDVPVALYRKWDGDLSDWIPRDAFSDNARIAFLAYLTSALIHCRNRGISTHQDIKPQNILLRRIIQPDLPDHDAFWMPQLADFGLANLSNEFGRPDGARPYMAPEQWNDGEALPESDVFALGVLICETLSRGFHPRGEKVANWWPVPKGENSKKWTRDEYWQKWANQNCPIQIPSELHSDFHEIVTGCLCPIPSLRPSLIDIQNQLLQSLKIRNSTLFEQVDFQLLQAESPSSDHSWPYRDQCLANLESWYKEKWGSNQGFAT